MVDIHEIFEQFIRAIGGTITPDRDDVNGYFLQSCTVPVLEHGHWSEVKFYRIVRVNQYGGNEYPFSDRWEQGKQLIERMNFGINTVIQHNRNKDQYDQLLATLPLAEECSENNSCRGCYDQTIGDMCVMYHEVRNEMEARGHTRTDLLRWLIAHPEHMERSISELVDAYLESE